MHETQYLAFEALVHGMDAMEAPVEYIHCTNDVCRAARRLIYAERERCAKYFEDGPHDTWEKWEVAKAIREWIR